MATINDGISHIDLRQAIKKLDALPAMPVIAQKLLALDLDTDAGERMLLASNPGRFAQYALGAMQIEEMRNDAKRALGERFDLRVFHQLLLEDGLLPFPALRAKLDQWAMGTSGPAAR